MKAIAMAIVSLSACAALANPPAAPAKTATTTTTTTAPATAPAAGSHAGHDTAKTDDKCAGKTGKDLETCKAHEAKKMKK